MSEKEPIKPYRAKETSTGQEAADAVADVLSYAAERDEAAKKKTAPKPQPRWMLPLTTNLCLLAVYFLAAQPQWLVLSPIEPPPVAERMDDLRYAMYLHGIVRIEGFRQNNGRLPANLEEAGVAADVAREWDYTVVGGSTYTLVGSVEDEIISYDSATMTPQDFTGPMRLPG